MSEDLSFPCGNGAHLIDVPSKKPSLTLRMVKLLLAKAPLKNIPPIPRYLSTIRKGWEWLSHLLPMSPMVTCTPFSLGSLQAEWVIPRAPDYKATLLYLHGGAYCLGSITTHRSFLTYLSAYTTSRILAINYRLAPEYPFPAALKDALDAYKWLRTQEEEKPIYISGDSAGGGLALALLLTLKDLKFPLPTGTICFSPWIDLTCQPSSLKTHEDLRRYIPLLSAIANLYTASGKPYHPRISPVYGDFAGLPPLFVQVSRDELLFSDAMRLFEKVKQDNGNIILEAWQNMFHAWPYAASFLPEGREALTHVRKFMEKLSGCG
ncbi:MAG: alpha/beta hydrolase [Alphaproteobacteria bacterium]|jgi:acetyl esterase/lipase|nr:alpha/beta hydrolase [Alphaproteobacteria bacterium]